jgi:hypothetical protein
MSEEEGFEKSHNLPNPIDKMLVADLKAELKKRGLGTSGLKKDLLQRLKNALAQEEAQKEPSSKSIPSAEKTDQTNQENKIHEVYIIFH